MIDKPYILKIDNSNYRTYLYKSLFGWTYQELNYNNFDIGRYFLTSDI